MSRWPLRSLRERLLSKVQVDPSTGCWLWQAATDGAGYGVTRVGKRTRRAHQVSYECHVGPVPQGMELDHVKARGCIGPACINPAHLEPVIHVENIRRGTSLAILGSHQRTKTTCPQGHTYTVENTYVYKNTRACRTCKAARAQTKRNTRKNNA